MSGTPGTSRVPRLACLQAIPPTQLLRVRSGQTLPRPSTSNTILTAWFQSLSPYLHVRDSPPLSTRGSVFRMGNAGCREGVRRWDRVAASLACVERPSHCSSSLIRSTCLSRRSSAQPLLSGWPRNGTRTGFKSESRLALRNRRCLEAVFLLNDGKNKLDRRPQDT